MRRAAFRSIIADLPAAALLKAADAGRSRGLLFFNVGAIDDRLREEDCRGNVIHAAPTRSMLADALAQYLVWKQWRRWLLIFGSHAEDKLYGDALRRSAKRFGARIVQEKVFEDTGGARRTDSGVAQIQRQLPVFTQGAPAYDVLVAADESEVFAAYLPYRTWDPGRSQDRPASFPTTWDASHDQWGAVQMQNRFMKMFGAANDRTRHAGLVGGAHDWREPHRERAHSIPGPCSIFSRAPISPWPRSRVSD